MCPDFIYIHLLGSDTFQLSSTGRDGLSFSVVFVLRFLVRYVSHHGGRWVL